MSFFKAALNRAIQSLDTKISTFQTTPSLENAEFISVACSATYSEMFELLTFEEQIQAEQTETLSNTFFKAIDAVDEELAQDPSNEGLSNVKTYLQLKQAEMQRELAF